MLICSGRQLRSEVARHTGWGAIAAKAAVAWAESSIGRVLQLQGPNSHIPFSKNEVSTPLLSGFIMKATSSFSWVMRRI